jgi:excisionase family DNA binding protein
MTPRQLKSWLTQQLKIAEPLDSLSTMANPQAVATKAAKKLGLLGYGSGELLIRAGNVNSATECGAVIIDCLARLPESTSERTTTARALTVQDAADQLGVSKETVYKLCAEGTLSHTRIGRRITITQEHLAEFRETANC